MFFQRDKFLTLLWLTGELDPKKSGFLPFLG